MNTHTIDTSTPVISADDYGTSAFFADPDAIAVVTNTTAPDAVPLPSPDAATAGLLAAAQEAGFRAVPAPLAETALVARPLLRRAGLPAPDGFLSYAIAPELTVRYARPAASSVGSAGCLGDDDTLLVTGTLRRVPWARAATAVVVLATAPSGPVLFTLTPGRAALTPGGNLAGEPRDDLHLAALEIPASQVRRISPELLDEARLRAALARSALIAGAAERCVGLTVAHTTARTQFGRPLSRFQAVKQEEARLVEETALVRTAVQAAAAPLDTGGAAARFAVAAAKTQTSASAAEIARIAHQLHGAIGITRLHPLHLATTRLWSWRDEDGDETYWARRLARPLTATALWPTLTTTP
ncbi:acyl-CoA dehydrogenase family protein [Streptomyces eurocidicus]|uniref:Alkylation response protein AidB-like acyl-CoA dehydrogenase n=1 Tax=Streptomyces eurocidicus TaxID=66423 RepID=A0A7W8BF58_STREU|nr:acyl-CoA dehydrogenase family protein [Streptomyces eurocidicus]MBB5120778.1 alkylation response protein AidB-like acyl-CoA dehydrogenase [Streptomyces eurocidicus]MBF6054276.1 acyl-CoA dehydrogenase [Streptomyces eurocidicus]